jgi:hypothetical protein
MKFFIPGFLKVRLPRTGAAFFFLILVTYYSCKEKDIVGIDVLPSTDKLSFSSDTVSLISFSVREDSIKSDETSNNIVGSLHDPVFGITHAGFYSQVRLSAENVDFGNPNELEVDSLVLSLVVNNAYGKKTPIDIFVYELAEKIFLDSAYYSNRSIEVKKTKLGEAKNITPQIGDSILVGNNKEPVQLRIQLDKYLGVLFLNTPSAFTSNDVFLNSFKGLFVTVDTTSAPLSGEGSMFYFDVLNQYSKLTLYYRNKVTPDTLSFSFNINSSCARIGRYWQNYSGTEVSQQLANNSLGKDKIYLQSLAGVKSKILLPDVGKLISNGDIVVNKAEIVFSAAEKSNSDFPLHEQLFLVNIDSAGKSGFVADQLEGSAHFGGKYSSITGTYSFNITRHIQQLLISEKSGNSSNYGLFLVGGGAGINANRTIIYGSENNSGRIKLRVSYTQL